MKRFSRIFVVFFASIYSYGIFANLTSPEQYFPSYQADKHLRFDQIANYLNYVDKSTAKSKLIQFGWSEEGRPLYLLAVSSKKNIENLDEIRIRHEQLSNPYATRLNSHNLPVIVWLSFASHGDEPSGAHAAIKIIHYLLSNNQPEVNNWLNNSVLLFEVVANPDGFDQYANWVSGFYSDYPSSHAQHAKNTQKWPKSRGNHYWFDLNRDWLPQTQAESKARVLEYHKWKPNVLADFHEMQSNQSYFFQPGVKARINPLTPEQNIDLTKDLSNYTARAFDQASKLYYSEENFDDFYIGKGSTYPDLQGGLGILLEQAQSQGQQIQTQNGLLTFAQSVENQMTGITSMIRAANAKRKALIDFQQDFFRNNITLAQKDKVSGYLVQSQYDEHSLEQFLQLMSAHQIKVYPLEQDYQANDQLVFYKNTSYWIPLQQAQYRLIKSIFSRQTEFNDHTFYDVTNWNIALAYGLQHYSIEGRFFGVKAHEQPWDINRHAKTLQKTTNLTENAAGYLLDWRNGKNRFALSEILRNNIKVRVAKAQFKGVTPNGSKSFPAGSVLILRADNTKQAVTQFKNLVSQYNLRAHNLTTAHTPDGPDLGSDKVQLIELPKVATLAAPWVSQSEIGEFWYWLDKKIKLPLTMLADTRHTKWPLNDFTHLYLADGQYQNLTTQQIDQIKTWVDQGGTLIVTKRAAIWASQQQLIKNDYLSERDLSSPFKQNYDYANKESFYSEMRISGTVFKGAIDPTHPLGFGRTTPLVHLFRNDRVVLLETSTPFADVALYDNDPLTAGYVSPENINHIKNTVALTHHKVGSGRVIAFSDNPLFRGYWFDTAKMLTNSLFFAELID
ncbi:peptidase M14 carboxypeptidase A [Catenovulum agarivorans DS-2]|uniref:Peptidase M14 carboxypeptidase A n=1 Tax=Catenovulum agarivorans DS-2 TaxID=1328313 RepID=W7QI96_9ALTE|nr:M14 family zinc carboxypeptidase [Catenovulum agarivorans]EWH11566.1 peptidase M14 carboxypeptidase A [Catenovulum agarivorans DS-2]